MNLQLLRAYIQYRRKAKYYNGHGVHSPFMYEFVRSVFFAKKQKHESQRTQERIVKRTRSFCQQHNLQMLIVNTKNEVREIPNNSITILAQPHVNTDIWDMLRQNTNTQVSVDIWTLGLIFSIPHLQKQCYIVKI